MAQFHNNPELKDQSGEGKVKRYVHQPLTVEHYGLHAKIQENGRVVITGPPVTASDGEVEYDEVEVPASLVFKLATLLKATRTIKFVSVSEAATLPADVLKD
jgi:DNA/RNA endonuclease G (NUC1)